MVERAHNCFLATVEFNSDCVTLGKWFNECLWALAGLSLYYICCIMFWKGKCLTAKTWGFSRCPVMCKAFCSSQTFEQTPWSQHITGEWGQPGVSEHSVLAKWKGEAPWVDKLDLNLSSVWLTWGQSLTFSDPQIFHLKKNDYRLVIQIKSTYDVCIQQVLNSSLSLARYPWSPWEVSLPASVISWFSPLPAALQVCSDVISFSRDRCWELTFIFNCQFPLNSYPSEHHSSFKPRPNKRDTAHPAPRGVTLDCVSPFGSSLLAVCGI